MTYDDMSNFHWFLTCVFSIIAVYCITLSFAEVGSDVISLNTLDKVCNNITPGTEYKEITPGLSSSFVCVEKKVTPEKNYAFIIKGDE